MHFDLFFGKSHLIARSEERYCSLTIHIILGYSNVNLVKSNALFCFLSPEIIQFYPLTLSKNWQKDLMERYVVRLFSNLKPYSPSEPGNHLHQMIIY